MFLPVSGMASPDFDKSFVATADMNRDSHLSVVRIYENREQKVIPLPEKPKNQTTSPHHNRNTSFRTDFSALQYLENATAFHWRASLKIQARMKHRKMKLVDYRFTDVNNDGKSEVVTLAETPASRGNVMLVLGVYDFDDKLTPILRYEKTQIVDNAEHRTYVQQIEPRSPGFSFCENWKIASWNVNECHEIVMDLNWKPGVLTHQVRTSEPKAHSAQSNAFNFEKNMAMRTYDRLPEGPFMPPLHREASYRLLFATQDAELAPVPVRLAHLAPASMEGDDHQPILLDSRWNENGLYFSMAVSDEDMIADLACSDQTSLQLSDHVEFWFDKSPDLVIQSDNPQSWMLEYQKDYKNEPYRHSLDNDVFGFAVTASGCLVPMAPTRDAWPVMPQILHEKTQDGYRVDVFMPAAFFGVDSLKKLDNALGLGVSMRQHDMHDNDSWQSIATSEFQWPDPFTIGQIWLLPASAVWPPPFPMQWSSWLVDN